MDGRALSTARRCKRLGRLWLHGLFTRRSPDFKHGLLAYNLLGLRPSRGSDASPESSLDRCERYGEVAEKKSNSAALRCDYKLA